LIELVRQANQWVYLKPDRQSLRPLRKAFPDHSIESDGTVCVRLTTDEPSKADMKVIIGQAEATHSSKIRSLRGSAFHRSCSPACCWGHHSHAPGTFASRIGRR
jgi:lactam utilization protein B